MSNSTPVIRRDTPLMREIYAMDGMQKRIERHHPAADAKAMAADFVTRAWKDARRTNEILGLMAPEVARVLAAR